MDNTQCGQCGGTGSVNGGPMCHECGGTGKAAVLAVVEPQASTPEPPEAAPVGGGLASGGQ